MKAEDHERFSPDRFRNCQSWLDYGDPPVLTSERLMSAPGVGIRRVVSIPHLLIPALRLPRSSLIKVKVDTCRQTQLRCALLEPRGIHDNNK